MSGTGAGDADRSDVHMGEGKQESLGIEEFIARFSTVARTAYPDLEFLSPGGQLHLHQQVDAVRRLRFQLPHRQFLHLHSIALETTGDLDPVSQTRIGVSSERGAENRTAISERLFDWDGKHRLAFHTEDDEQPWLEITFDQPVNLTRISLRNVPRANSGRAGGLQVTAECEDGQQRMLYDGAARVAAFTATAEGMAAYIQLDSEVCSPQLCSILRDIVVADLDDLPPRLKDLPGATPKDRLTIRGAVNATLLEGRSLEWNIHAVRRTFRYWGTGERRAYVRDTAEIINDLKGLSDHVCLGFGGVLGLVREGGLIPHDDDLDIIIGLEPHQAETLADGIRAVRRHLRPLGYKVWGDQLAHQYVTRGHRPKVDLFVGLFEGDRIAWYPSARGSLDRTEVFPALDTPLLGHNIRIPRSPLVYLEKVYGRTWRTPNAGYAHRWGRQPYQDIAGELNR